MEHATEDTAAAADTAGSRGRAAALVRGVGWTLVAVGLLILGFVAQQLWVTDFFAERHQSALHDELEKRFDDARVTAVPFVPGVGPAVDDPTALPSTSAPTTAGDSELQYYIEEAPAVGEAFGQIRIPAIDVDWTFVEGDTLSVLKSGAGHMPTTAVPGQIGNAVISGHRTTYGRPFHDLDKLAVGDRIEVETALGVHVYEVRESRVVQPTALWVVYQPGTPGSEWEGRDGAWLTLTTCHPKFSARERLIVFAELVEGPNALLISSLA